MNFIMRRLMHFDTYAVTAFFLCFSAVEIFYLGRRVHLDFFYYPAHQGFYSTSHAGKKKTLFYKSCAAPCQVWLLHTLFKVVRRWKQVWFAFWGFIRNEGDFGKFSAWVWWWDKVVFYSKLLGMNMIHYMWKCLIEITDYFLCNADTGFFRNFFQRLFLSDDANPKSKAYWA